MKLLILGGNSFAATGLRSLLEQDGHEVFDYVRGAPGRTGNTITGPADKLASLQEWPATVDCVINCVLLRDRSIADNIAFCGQVLELCRKLQCRRLLHLSSIAVYDVRRGAIRETTASVRDEKGWPFYAGVKIATDEHLLKNGSDCQVVFVRPGFILARGLGNAMVGSAAQLPGGLDLILGNPRQFFPVVSRSDVQSVLRKAVDPASPARREYIGACVSELGQGLVRIGMGAWFWFPVGVLVDTLSMLRGRGTAGALRRIAAGFRRVTFDSRGTEERLGMKFSGNWRAALRDSYDLQEPNIVLPANPERKPAQPDGGPILFLGFGSIVGQKHLPALQATGYKGVIEVFDPFLQSLPGNGSIRRMEDPQSSPAPLTVVATPGPAHVAALQSIPTRTRVILLEKPVSPYAGGWTAWKEYAEKGPARVLVCHNYRYKRNVLALFEALRRVNPGVLRRCVVRMNSGVTGDDQPKWRRDERGSRILLYDFGIHYLDLACLWGTGFDGIEQLETSRDSRGRTAEISGRIRFSNYPVDFQLTQSHGPTRFQVDFEFANYIARLTFHPDTLTLLSGPDLIVNRAKECWHEFATVARYAIGKLSGRDADQSHARVYEEAFRSMTDPGYASPIALQSLAPIYRILGEIATKVYD